MIVWSGPESHGCFWPVCRVCSRSSFWSSARRVGGPGCTDFPALPTRFAASPREEYRIVVLGGSSASGEPFWPWLSVGQIVAWRLSEAVADRRFACEILAYPGDSLEMQHHKLAALKRRPDAVIIYAGHNEFVARFEEEREGWLDEHAGTGIARLAYRATSSSSFCSLAYEIISKNRLDRPPSLGPPA